MRKINHNDFISYWMGFFSGVVGMAMLFVLEKSMVSSVIGSLIVLILYLIINGLFGEDAKRDKNE